MGEHRRRRGRALVGGAALCAAVAGLALGASCSSEEPAAGADAAAPEAGVDAIVAVDAPEPVDATESAVGLACKASPDGGVQGTCPPGLACFPAPGGYCTTLCGFASCPPGSACVLTPKDGPLCARSCASSGDCRTREGYSCDPGWKACTQWVSSPRLASCPGAAPARKAFGPVTQLSTGAGPGKYHMEPAAALDSRGALSVLYMARNDLLEGSALGVSTLAASGQLDKDRTLATPSKFAFDAWMARDRAGKLHAVYFGHDGFDVNSKIWYTTSADGVTWAAPRNVLDAADCPTGAACTDKPMIAIGPDKADPTRDLVVISYGAPSGTRLLRSTDGGSTFSKGALVAGIGVYGDLEIASDGSVHLTGARGGGSPLGAPDNAVEYAVSADGALTFSPLRSVKAAGESTPFYFVNPQVVWNAAGGRLHVVYAAGAPDGRWDIQLATSTDGGATFSRVKVNDDAPCANHATPTVALEPGTGRLHVAWLENRGGVGRAAYTTCAADGATCAPSEAISDAPFAAYELVRHSPVWMGEYFSLFFNPAGTELHAVWTQPVTEPSGPRSRIFHAKRATP
ncbi:MAG TPA: sialidase family protein [Polyangiaceae bacterium]|nr:sialidase family protein [Polyangiaceae bacterium]